MKFFVAKTALVIGCCAFFVAPAMAGSHGYKNSGEQCNTPVAHKTKSAHVKHSGPWGISKKSSSRGWGYKKSHSTYKNAKADMIFRDLEKQN